MNTLTDSLVSDRNVSQNLEKPEADSRYLNSNISRINKRD